VTPLGPEQRQRVLALAVAARGEPAARDWTSVGCTGLVLAAAGLALLPTVARLIGPRGATAGAILLGVLGVAGIALWLLGASLGLAPVRRRIESAVAVLTGEGAAESEAALAAAVTLLVNAHHAPGPYTSETYAAEEMAGRLGNALPLVIAVEEVLLEDGRIYPVFTPVRSGDG
jgi:hypothetical protein